MPETPQQVIYVASRKVPLPEGVTVSDWALEKVRWQNPRIRAFLGSIRLLGGVLESNYALLHCSPERLSEIWRKVRKVAILLQDEMLPLLARPSCIPALDEARSSAELSLQMLSDSVLQDLRSFPEEAPPGRLMELRKLLCVSIGQLHSFLHDAFGELMAADPRSLHDADYFISKRFPQDVDEAEWLHSTVERLESYLSGLDSQRDTAIPSVARGISRSAMLPSEDEWRTTELFLDELLQVLTPKIKEVLALRGIRFHEMEILDRYAVDLPLDCRILRELVETSREMLPDQEGQVAERLHGVLAPRVVRILQRIDSCIMDLAAFIPLWLQGIESRRALLLRRPSANGGPADEA